VDGAGNLRMGWRRVVAFQWSVCEISDTEEEEAAESANADAQ
jgi:hypothetical protein